MTKIHRTPRPEAAQCLARLRSDVAYRREIARASGLSELTVRQVAETGRVASYASGLILERATGGEMSIADLGGDVAKGAQFYNNRSAHALLDKAIEARTPMSRYIAGYGLTVMDLWYFVNAPKGQNEKAKEKVRKVLRELELPIDEEAAE